MKGKKENQRIKEERKKRGKGKGEGLQKKMKSEMRIFLQEFWFFKPPADPGLRFRMESCPSLASLGNARSKGIFKTKS